MRRLCRIAAILVVAIGSGADVAAGADWRTPLDLTGVIPGPDDMSVAVGANGDAIVLWDAPDGSSSSVIWAMWSLGNGAFTEPVRISGEGEVAYAPEGAIDAAGDAIAVWGMGAAAPARVIQTASKPAGGSFGAVDTLSAANASGQRVALAEDGGAVVAWQQNGVGVAAAYRAPGGGFSDPDGVSFVPVAELELAADPAGNAFAIWTEEDAGFQRVVTAFRAAGGTFGSLDYRSAGGAAAGGPDVAMNAAGDVLVAWSWDNGSEYELQATGRPAGGTFEPVQVVSDPPNSASLPSVGLDDAGGATLAWVQNDADADVRIWAATRFGEGTFSDPEPVSADGFDAYNARVANGAAGSAVISWDRTVTGGSEQAEAIIRQSGAPFSTVKQLSGDADDDTSDPRVGMDAAGNALVPWMSYDPPDWRLRAAVFDATPPVVPDVVVPATATVGVPIEVSSSPFDRWSPFTAGWSFGDGATAEGPSATHAYTAPGVFDVAVTATDAVAYATTETRQVTVSPPTPPTPLLPAAPAVLASVSDLSIAPHTFLAAARGASVARRRRVGGRVTFRLNVAADVRFTVRRRARGRRVGGRCVRPTRRNRARRRCARFVRVRGSFTRASTAGANRFRFTGRLRGRRLRPGRYRLVATPRVGSVAGARRRTAFRIVPRRR